MDASILTSLVPSLFQGGMGIFQGILSSLDKRQRPVQEVPASVKQATDVAENLASGNMPGYANTKAQIDLGAGEAINSAKGSGNIGSTVADILAKMNESNLALGTQNAQFKTNATQNYQNQLNRQGQYEDKAFQYNEIDKYNRGAAADSALKQASTQNIFDMINNFSGTASYNGLFNSLFGDKQKEENSYYNPIKGMNFSGFKMMGG